MWAAVAVWRKADLTTMAGGSCTGWSNLRSIVPIYEVYRYVSKEELRSMWNYPCSKYANVNSCPAKTVLGQNMSNFVTKVSGQKKIQLSGGQNLSSTFQPKDIILEATFQRILTNPDQAWFFDTWSKYCMSVRVYLFLPCCCSLSLRRYFIFRGNMKVHSCWDLFQTWDMWSHPK